MKHNEQLKEAQRIITDLLFLCKENNLEYTYHNKSPLMHRQYGTVTHMRSIIKQAELFLKKLT